MPTFLESLGPAPQSLVPTSVMEPVTPLAAPPDPFESAGWEEAKEATDPFAEAGWQEVVDPFTEAGWKEADDLDLRSVDELNADRDKFNPQDYYTNNPDVASDPKKLAKLLDITRLRDKEGLDAAQVAKAAATEALPTVGKVFGGLRDATAGALNVALQPAANVLGSIFTGDIFDPQMRAELVRETKKVQKKGVAEFAAGSELSASGAADLGRQLVQKLPKPTGNMKDATFEEVMYGKPRPEKTDQELLQKLAAGAEFGKQMLEVAQGRGETAKALGLDAETLAKDGIELDPEVIERLSLVDPLTLVAGGGIFKGVTAAGRTVFTAGSRAAAEKVMERFGQVAAKAATAPIYATGKVAQAAGWTAKKAAPFAPAVGTVSGGLQGGFAGAGGGYLAGQAVEKVLAKGGALAQSAGGGIAKAGQALGNSATLQKALRGATEGAIASAPLVAATDDDRTAGALLGAGVALGGGIRGAIGLAGAPGLSVSKSRLAPKPIVYPETRSRGYGMEPGLDKAHTQAMKELPVAEQNELNAFRETTRKLGAEIYLLDPEAYSASLQEYSNRIAGRELTSQENVNVANLSDTQGYFDVTLPAAEGQTRRVIFLNSKASALTHESGHLFKALLSPERQADLLQAARDSYTSEQIAAYKAEYETRLRRAVSEDSALEEVIAENFSQLLRNRKLSDLNTPPAMLEKIGRSVTDFAEQLGLDLTAGVETPAGAPSSLRLNTAVHKAAKDILFPETPKAEPRTATPKVERKVEAPKDVIEEAQKIVAEAPDTTLPGAARSQRELLGTVAEIIAGKEGARYNYRNAPDAPGAADEAARTPRRAEIEQARNMPEDVRRMTETTGFPYRISKSSGGVIQVLDWTPDMLASNAFRWAKALSELAVKDPNNAALKEVKYGLDVQGGEWTEQGWRDIFRDAEIYSENSLKGFAGSGIDVVFPPEVVAAGRSAPSKTGTPKALDQNLADFQNLLYNLRVPKTPRAGAKLPGNLVSQKISEATLPGRLREPALVEPRKAGESGKRKAFKSGEEILDPNPLRAELEIALQKNGIALPDGIEVVRRLNLEHMADVVAEPNLPRTAGAVVPVVEAGFQPRPGERNWRISGQVRGAKQELTVSAVDMAAARKQAEAQGMRVASIEAADKMATAMFQPKAGEREWRVSGQRAGSETQLTIQAADMAAARKQAEAQGMRVASVEAADKMTNAMFSPRTLADQVEKFSPEEFRVWVSSVEANFTGEAHKLGMAAPDQEFTDSLKTRYESIAPKAMQAIRAGSFDDASALASQAQFFREAYEAATGTASAAAALRRLDPDYKPPFPIDAAEK